MTRSKYKAVVIGLSSGGLEAMKTMFPLLPKEFGLPIIMVQHISPLSTGQWISLIDRFCVLNIKEADEKEEIIKGNIYIAPPNYHLLIENDHTFSLSTEGRVNFARPAIDVLFQTAADAYGETLIGIVLTGSNHDGAMGLKLIKDKGGLCIAQDPEKSISPYMPSTAIATANPHFILSLEEIIHLLIKLDNPNSFPDEIYN